MFAFAGDVLTFYRDNLARESRLVKATLRKSVMALSKMLGHPSSWLGRRIGKAAGGYGQAMAGMNHPSCSAGGRSSLRRSYRRYLSVSGASPCIARCEKSTRIQRRSRRKLHLELPHRSHRRLPVQRTPSESTTTRTDTTTAVFLRMPTVMRMTGLGRSTIYRLIADQKFPCPVRLGPRAVAWRRSDLDRWSEARPAVTH
jgi:prophage regulatory protein